MTVLSPGLSSYQAFAAEFSEPNPEISSLELTHPSAATPLNEGPSIAEFQDLPVDAKIDVVLPAAETKVLESKPSLPQARALPKNTAKTAPAFFPTPKESLPQGRRFFRSLVKKISGVSPASRKISLGVLNRLFDRQKKSRSLSLPSVQDISRPSAHNLALKAGLSGGVEKPEVRLPIESAGNLEDAPSPRKFKWLREIQELPSQFLWKYVPGWSIAAMGGEMQAVALPVFTAQVFGLSQAIIASGVNLIARIPGAWTGAFFVGHFSPKVINNAALIISALSGGLVPAAIFLHLSHAALLGAFLLGSALSGLVYGATRGVTENLIPPLLIADRSQREFGLNYAYQWVELSSIAMAMISVPLLHVFGGSVMLGISSSFFLISTLFYASLKLHKPNASPASPVALDKTSEKGLSWRNYVPFVFFRLMHFSLYAVFAAAISLGILHSDKMTGNIIGSYDFGSWVFGFLATMALLPKKGERSWTFFGVGTALAFLWASSLLSIPALSMVLAGVMGGMIMINSNKWMSLYQEKLHQSKLKNLSKWMMTASILGTLPIFIAASLSQIFPAWAAVLTMPHIIIFANILVTILGILTLLAFKSSR